MDFDTKAGKSGREPSAFGGALPSVKPSVFSRNSTEYSRTASDNPTKAGAPSEVRTQPRVGHFDELLHIRIEFSQSIPQEGLVTGDPP